MTEGVIETDLQPNRSLDAEVSAATLRNPFEVVRATGLTTEEKRALLSFWLSDIHAVPDRPGLRRLEDGTVLHIDALRTALQALDGTSRLARRLTARACVDNRQHAGAFRPHHPDGGRPPRGRRSALPPPPEFVDARAGAQRSLRATG